MKPWPLRLCKAAPLVTGAALFGYTCAIITDQRLVTGQLNAAILTWLGLVNVAALGTLFWALITDRVDDLRVMVARSRPNPRLRFMPLHAVPDLPAPPAWNKPTDHGVLYGMAAVERGTPPTIDPWTGIVKGYRNTADEPHVAGPEDTQGIAS